jgi:acetolactate synthase-1/2/3 large subunit
MSTDSLQGQEWQSDVIVDLIKQFEFPHITLNPGASYRGLHDSLVNYGNNDPAMILCQHEKIAIQIAHGYAKTTGTPMVAIVHNVVGLLHATLGIYYAYLDRAPIFVVGATGPMDEGKRRPFLDWIHTANVQGEQVRNYVKWDYQPTSIDGVADSFARAYSIMMTEPRGPVYMCYDAWLQEMPLEAPVALPDPDCARVPTAIAPDPRAIDEAAQRLVSATSPVLLAEYVARAPHGYDDLVELAETTGAVVFDVASRLNFPSEHPLNGSMDGEVFRTADLIVALDVQDWERPTHKTNGTLRTKEQLYPDSCTWVEIGFNDLNISKWSMDYQRFPDCAQKILADTLLAIPALTAACKKLIAADPAIAQRIAQRKTAAGAHRKTVRDGWREQANKKLDGTPIQLPRLALDIWDAIKDEDWVLTAGTLDTWARKLWNFDRPYRTPGRALGTATQIGISLGVALAHKGSGRLVVDLQPDGDLMFDAGALWTAARYEIPMLVVMHNNRAYYNDWDHQISVARHRGTPLERTNIGMDIVEPPPDFAGLARSMGWYAEGPIERPEDVPAALQRAIAVVKSGKPALIDTITRRRHE